MGYELPTTHKEDHHDNPAAKSADPPHRSLEDLSPEELAEILNAPIELTPEAKARHAAFVALLDRTAGWTWRDLMAPLGGSP